MSRKSDRPLRFLMPKVRGNIPIEVIERAVAKVLADRRARKAAAGRSRTNKE